MILRDFFLLKAQEPPISILFDELCTKEHNLLLSLPLSAWFSFFSIWLISSSHHAPVVTGELLGIETYI